jgi:hypothetical protein
VATASERVVAQGDLDGVYWELVEVAPDQAHGMAACQGRKTQNILSAALLVGRPVGRLRLIFDKGEDTIGIPCILPMPGEDFLFALPSVGRWDGGVFQLDEVPDLVKAIDEQRHDESVESARRERNKSGMDLGVCDICGEDLVPGDPCVNLHRKAITAGWRDLAYAHILCGLRPERRDAFELGSYTSLWYPRGPEPPEHSEEETADLRAAMHGLTEFWKRLTIPNERQWRLRTKKPTGVVAAWCRKIGSRAPLPKGV